MTRKLLGSVLVFASLALHASVAPAATTDIGADPFNQATCAASTSTKVPTNHHANVEPDSFAFGSTVVAAYQVGRIYDGGACDIGFSVSTDGGTSWTSGLLPGITKYAGGGKFDRVTDASVAYDARHATWLVSSLALTEAGGLKGAAVLTSLSKDGLTWSAPVTTNDTSVDSDKNWIVCDNTVSSPFYGNCYTQWDDHGAGNKLYMSTSSDGGITWSPPTTNNAGVIGGQPVVLPSGIVVVPTANANETAIGYFRSTDGGLTWSAMTTISTVRHHTVAGSLREGPLPSAEVDGGGHVYVAWADCRFRQSCKTNDIVFVKSLDTQGMSWSAVTRVPIDQPNSGIDHFIPGIAVNPADASNGKIGLTYYYYAARSTSLNVGFISSLDGGSTWSFPAKMNAAAFPSTWVATTSQGRMVGDYISTSFTSDLSVHGIVGVATAPGGSATASCTTTALDNCLEPIATFSVPLGSAAVVASTGPVLFSGAGGTSAQSLWNIVANNGAKHRD